MPLKEHQESGDSTPAAISHHLGHCLKLLEDESSHILLIDHAFAVLANLLGVAEKANRKILLLSALEIVKSNLGLEEEVCERITNQAAKLDNSI